MLLTWLPDSLELRSQVHEIHGKLVALIYVAPNPAGCAFFWSDGNHSDPKKKPSFRAGDVYFRDGTQSRRLNQRGFEMVIEQRLASERQKWDEERSSDFRRLAAELRAGSEGQRVARGPAAEFNLSLDTDVLTAAAIELLRAKDSMPIRRLLTRSVQEARDLVERKSFGDLESLLDRLVCLAATFLEVDEQEWFERTVAALLGIYGLPWEQGPIGDQPPPDAARLWLAVIERVYALGSLATRLENWRGVATLIRQRDPRMHSIYPSWLRHAVTMAFRARLFDSHEPNHEVSKVSLLSLARGHVRRLECLRPDVSSEDERVLDSLTQFDLLASVVGAHANAGMQSRGFYTNFARFYSRRSDPIAERLVTDRALRDAVFPHDDEALAKALVNVAEMALQESAMYDGWSGYETEPVQAFIEAHYTE
jgi:hypothetical protein